MIPGTGIEPATLRRVFDPFFTTKSNGKGTGLGLALVWKIVEAHGGAIEVTTEPGEGTQFAVYLPLCDDREVAVVAGQPASAAGNERILFVDDEEAIRKLGRQLLERRGYRVSTASDGMEARDMVVATPGEYDLVITDLGMPRLNGVDFARAVRALRPDLPIILTTGYAEALTDEALSDLKVQGVIFKPYKAEEIRRTVRQALDGGLTLGDGHREHTRT